METIITRHGEGKLATKVFFSSESGFNVASVIVMGKKECVLIDCQWTLANAYRVIAEIIETGLELKAIFATHAHPDHYWGMGAIADAFPNAKCYMLPRDCEIYNHQYQPKLDEWTEIIGEGNLCRKQCDRLEPLTDNVIMLEGERIEIIPEVMGDLKWNSAVWIPSISTLYGSDILFNEAHPFTCEVSAEQRKMWYEEIEKFERELKPQVVIPGHQREGCKFDGTALDYTKAYLKATEEEIANTNSAAEFFYAMIRRFPTSSLIMLSDEMNAEVLKGGRAWDWNED
ncbi:MAG: MBL fold metallo-hydrolase [Oscillospiraceae bacterium]|nr:MBL fold metallo-hydrolase [Oscillospiraceae bacterium]